MLIWGTRRQVVAIALLRFKCAFCFGVTPQRLNKRVTKFTLFFIPLFTTSRTYFVECVTCGGSCPVSQDYAEQHIAGPGRPSTVPVATAPPTEPQSRPTTTAAQPHVDQMRRLVDLYAEGVLSREEFDAARARLVHTA